MSNENFGHSGMVTMRGNRTIVLAIRDDSSKGAYSEEELAELQEHFEVLGGVELKEDGVFVADMGKQARLTDYWRIEETLKVFSTKHDRKMQFSMRASDDSEDIGKILQTNYASRPIPNLPPVQTNVPMPDVEPPKQEAPSSRIEKSPNGTAVCIGFSSPPDHELLMKLHNAFPVSGSWLDAFTFKVEISTDHESGEDIAAAVYHIVQQHAMAKPKKFVDRFLSGRDPLRIPPRPGSDALKHQVAVKGAVSKNRNADIGSVIQDLEKHIEERTPGEINEEALANDTAIKALAALRQTQINNHKRIVKARWWRFLIVALLVLAGWLVYQYNEYLFDRGYTTAVLDCSVPYGNDRLTGHRYVTSEYRSLFGVRLSFDSDIKDVTKLNLPNDTITLLGVNPKNNKWWRMNFGKGEQGAQPMKPTDQYWFVGPKDTATVSYSAFCVKG